MIDDLKRVEEYRKSLDNLANNFEIRLAGVDFIRNNKQKYNVGGKSYQLKFPEGNYKCNFSGRKQADKLIEQFNEHYYKCSIINI